jgi:alcohol dehydrogenase
MTCHIQTEASVMEEVVKAWRLYGAGGRFAFEEVDKPRPQAGGVVIRMEAAPVLSYMRQVVDGTLGYALPRGPFTPGTNGVGVIEAVGSGVYHLKTGQRVALSPHHVVDERVTAPAQMLIGLTAMGSARFSGIEDSVLALQADWPDGVFAEYAHLPAACVTPAAGLESMPADRLAALGKLLVPYGGLLRGKLQPGATVIINGATGFYGSAGVIMALTMGAARVVAAGRDKTALKLVQAAGGARVAVVPLSGDTATDTASLRDAAAGGADMALDIVGRADSAASTLSTMRALRRGGRLVLMGSIKEPLSLSVGEMLSNDWSVCGNFMYPKDATARLVAMAASGMLDLSAIKVRCFPLAELSAAIDAAGRMRALDLTVVTSA